jgi:hypothetical protein
MGIDTLILASLNYHTTMDHVGVGTSRMKVRTLMKSVPDLLTTIPSTLSPRIRFFLRGDSEPTTWGTWVISPIQGYWELQGYGPFRIADVEKCQIRFESLDECLNTTMTENGFFSEEQNMFSRTF